MIRYPVIYDLNLAPEETKVRTVQWCKNILSRQVIWQYTYNTHIPFFLRIYL